MLIILFRVSIGMELVADARIVILDEPTTGLASLLLRQPRPFLKLKVPSIAAGFVQRAEPRQPSLAAGRR